LYIYEIQVSTARAWCLIAFLWVAYFLNYCDRQVVYALFPVLKANLGFSNAQLGLTGSIFLWTTAVATPFAGPISARYSKRWLIVWNLLLWSAATAFTGLSVSPVMLLSGRALLGITEALFIPIAITMIGSALPAAMRARAVGVFFTAQLCGVVIGGSLGGWIAEHWGWRYSFFGLGLAGALFAAPLASFFRGLPEPAVAPAQGHTSQSFLRDLFSVPSFVVFCACFPAFLVLLTIVLAWLSNFLYERFALSLAQAAFAATVYVQAGTGLGLLCGSLLSDRLYRRSKQARFWMLSAAMVVAAPSVYVLVHSGSLALAQCGAAGFGLANGIFASNVMVAPFDVIAPRARTAAIAAINTISTALSGLATLAAGIWKDSFGIPNLMSVFAAITLLSGALLFFSTRFHFDKDYRRLAV
jgi:predicted MFS family arabinose efflux permease